MVSNKENHLPRKTQVACNFALSSPLKVLSEKCGSC